MNPSQLVRDSEKVLACLKELPDGRLVTTRDLKVYIPSRYAEHGLAEIGIETNILGIFALVLDDKYYANLVVDAFVRTEPTSTVRVMVEDTEYFEFFYEAGSTVISSLDLVQMDVITYRIYNEFIAGGHVPWYMSYVEDMAGLFDTAKEHANANVGQRREVIELLISMIARDDKNRMMYYRQAIKALADLTKNPPVWIPLKSVTYSATNTTNKLLGNHFDEGITSALVSPTTRVEPIENTLRR